MVVDERVKRSSDTGEEGGGDEVVEGKPPNTYPVSPPPP